MMPINYIKDDLILILKHLKTQAHHSIKTNQISQSSSSIYMFKNKIKNVH